MKIKNKKELKELLKDKVYMADEEIPIFSKYVSLSKGNLVEIGAGLGASTALMLTNAPENSLVFSIDSFTGDTIKNFSLSKDRCIKNVNNVLNSLDLSKNTKRWNLFDKPSNEVASSWNKSIDFLFIDGDHTYKGVKQDFNNWFKHVKNDGFILLHDSRRISGTKDNVFNRGWEGPTKLANELKERDDLKLIDEVYSLTIWKKIK